MAGKGLCCAAQAAGDLGKPLLVTVHHKDGTTSTRCGTCEVVPSCRNQAVPVFAFRFLKSAVCGLTAASCAPTAAGVAQYRSQQAIAARGGELLEYPVTTIGGRDVLGAARRIALPAPYSLPNP